MTRSSYWDEFHNEPEDDHLEHHGVLGMKWGHRKQRIAAQRDTFRRASEKASKEHLTAYNALNGQFHDQPHWYKRSKKHDQKQASNYMYKYDAMANGTKEYSKRDVRLASKYVNGKKSLKQIKSSEVRHGFAKLAKIGLGIAGANLAADYVVYKALYEPKRIGGRHHTSLPAITSVSRKLIGR